jgi:hypothetical protein
MTSKTRRGFDLSRSADPCSLWLPLAPPRPKAAQSKQEQMAVHQSRRSLRNKARATCSSPGSLSAGRGGQSGSCRALQGLDGERWTRMTQPARPETGESGQQGSKIYRLLFSAPRPRDPPFFSSSRPQSTPNSPIPTTTTCTRTTTLGFVTRHQRRHRNSNRLGFSSPLRRVSLSIFHFLHFIPAFRWLLARCILATRRIWPRAGSSSVPSAELQSAATRLAPRLPIFNANNPHASLPIVSALLRL